MGRIGRLDEEGVPGLPSEVRVQVLMATRNGARFLRPQLESIVAQQGVEVVLRVLDDNSSDETLNIVRQFSGLLEVEVVKARVPIGLPGSFLSLLDAARDDVLFTAFADQDDIWTSEKLSSACAGLLTRSRTLWMSDARIIDPQARVVRDRLPLLRGERIGFSNALVQTPRPGCCMVFTSDLLPHLQEIDPKRIVMHDSWLYLCASAFGSVISDSRRLVSYRIHESNSVGLANSPVQRSRRLLERAIRRSSPWAVQARYLLERSGQALSERQRQAAKALCEPDLRGVRTRTELWARGEFRAAHASQDALLLAALLVPLQAD